MSAVAPARYSRLGVPLPPGYDLVSAKHYGDDHLSAVLIRRRDGRHIPAGWKLFTPAVEITSFAIQDWLNWGIA